MHSNKNSDGSWGIARRVIGCLGGIGLYWGLFAAAAVRIGTHWLIEEAKADHPKAALAIWSIVDVATMIAIIILTIWICLIFNPGGEDDWYDNHTPPFIE